MKCFEISPKLFLELKLSYKSGTLLLASLTMLFPLVGQPAILNSGLAFSSCLHPVPHCRRLSWSMWQVNDKTWLWLGAV